VEQVRLITTGAEPNMRPTEQYMANVKQKCSRNTSQESTWQMNSIIMCSTENTSQVGPTEPREVYGAWMLGSPY